PVAGGEDQDRRTLPTTDLGLGRRSRLLHGGDLDALAFGVQFVEAGRDDEGLVLVGEYQEPRPEGGVADAPAGIDARADHEAEVVGIEWPVDACGKRQRRNARIAP